jgi:tetratricopeptide (TPR) repeat protein
LPRLGAPKGIYDIYEKLGYIDKSKKPEEDIKFYETPILTWSNYKVMNKYPEPISPNQLALEILMDSGIKYPDYFNYLLKLREKYPYLNNNIVNKNNLMKDDLINNYYLIEYDIMFGNQYLAIGERDKSLFEYEQALRIDPNDVTTIFNIANVYLQQKKYDPAIELYEKAIALDPNYAAAHRKLGDAFFRLKKYKNAILEYSKALQIKPGYVSVYPNYIAAHVYLGQPSQARKLVLEAGKFGDDAGSSAYNEFGWACAEVNDINSDIESCKEFVRLKPEAYKYDSLGYAYLKAGMYPEALEALKEAVSLDPEAGYAHARMAQVYEKLGRNDEAFEEYKSAVQNSPENVEARYALGLNYAKKRQLAEAIEKYKALKKMDEKKAAKSGQSPTTLQLMIT